MILQRGNNMNKVILTGKIKDYPTKKKLNLIYSFEADTLEQIIQLEIACSNEQAMDKIIDLFDVDTLLLIAGSLKIKENLPVVLLEEFHFLQTYQEKILSYFMTPEEVQEFINNNDIDIESLLNDEDDI